MTARYPLVDVSGQLQELPSGDHLPVDGGGTGATTQAGARTALGLAIGSDVQAYNARLADIAGISWAQGDILYFNGTNLVRLAAGTNGYFLKTQGAGANPLWASATGSLADGDYGDISVSSGGAVLSIDADAVTFAKMQNIATDRLIGRDTAGSGDPEELTVSGGLEFSGSGGIRRSALTGDVTATAGSNATTVENVNYSATLTATGTPPTNAVGYLGAPQNLSLDSGDYTLALTDCGKHVYHTDANTRTLTIPANASVAFPIGTIIAGVNEDGAGLLSIVITTDTLRWSSSTGSRSVAANGAFSLMKVAATVWRLTGEGIT